MNREEISRIAKEAGIADWDITMTLIRFGEMVAAEEREQCARLFDEVPNDDFYPGSQYAEAIRSRGEK
jgi:hypothetical protein